MRSHWFPIFLIIITGIVAVNSFSASRAEDREAQQRFNAFLSGEKNDTVWRGWNKYEIPAWTDSGRLIWYGHELIASTSVYLGPKGTVAQMTNGMNCQNCHLDGGTLPFGNNFGKVYATYPLFRARNNGVQSIYDRVNDCLERSLNGHKLDSNSKEMRAIYAYIKWLGNEVPKGQSPGGTSIMKLPYLKRAANPQNGRLIYASVCSRCHGNNGEGQPNIAANGYIYPPLWGEHSYNDGAGLYRLGAFAGFVKNNMPFGNDYHHTTLSNEDAWDLAAFVNSQPRPHYDQRLDWKNVAKKPIDFPFGPYADTFSEQQHKYGPYEPILNAQ